MLEDFFFRGGEFVSAVVASTPVQTLVFTLQLLGVLLSFALLALIVFVLFKKRPFKSRVRNLGWFLAEQKESKDGSVAHAFSAVKERLESKETDLRTLVDEATALVERALTEQGYAGGTLREQLAHMTPAELRNIGEVLSAAAIAERLRRGEHAEVLQEEAEAVVAVYESALIELGVIS